MIPSKLHAHSVYRRHFWAAGEPSSKIGCRELVREQRNDLTIANGENSAAGFGITPALAEDFFELSIDVITTGNHVWDKREIIDYFQMVEGNAHGPARRVLRPANFPRTAGCGRYEGEE